MVKQIVVESAQGFGVKQMYDEAQSYLSAIGFTRTPMMSVNDRNTSFQSFVLEQDNEKIMIAYVFSNDREILKLIFDPLEIQFVYDILLLRFNQIAENKKDKIYIYNG